ncbi:MAG: PxxKW family cysteine-rich protein [Deltaproteobacteria bacterium]|nr:PxxKW family cysteine-rich protein [Candidatus Anaeroferrophillus wilburensis]MBN2888296.1 PxxKW family cysteine-rich protein [Deltaproteobacteria bacterium]
MICQSVRKGHECFLMKPAGCSYKDGECHPVVEQCEGCAKVVTVEDTTYCLTFPNPAAKWKSGICVMATHVKRNVEEIKKKINPLKASKRGGR